jgi:hypothetical protein
MECDGRAAASLAPDPQRDLLRHRPAREERGGRLAEQLADAHASSRSTLCPRP